LSAIIGSVVQSSSDRFSPSSFVVAFVPTATVEPQMRLSISSVHSVPSLPSFQGQAVADAIVGIVSSFLPPGLSAIQSDDDHLRGSRVLVTHADTPIGLAVTHTLSSLGLSIVEAGAGAGLVELASKGYASFDMIVSGFEGQSHTQILRSLLASSHGRLFQWNSELFDLFERDPYSLNAALRLSIPLLEKEAATLSSLPPSRSLTPTELKTLSSTLPRAEFHPTKAYIIQGGIGSLGASIALYMYEVC
jgi:hypothetical protein